MTTTKRKDFLILSEDLDSVDSEQIERVRYHEDRIGWHEAAQGVRA
ncbi:MAG: hypothetical protein MK243_08270 [Gemmatimonadetes bacterium]|jgi:hypothetical protein|nr:hypothetical protein [Gemmatimonadota bacterium]